jgi:predicted transcriptional regulator
VVNLRATLDHGTIVLKERWHMLDFPTSRRALFNQIRERWGTRQSAKMQAMDVRFRPETESRLQELADRSGRAPSDLIEDAMAAYLQEVAGVREMLDGRYEDLKSGRIQAVDGDAAFADLRRKSDERRSRS